MIGNLLPHPYNANAVKSLQASTVKLLLSISVSLLSILFFFLSILLFSFHFLSIFLFFHWPSLSPHSILLSFSLPSVFPILSLLCSLDLSSFPGSLSLSLLSYLHLCPFQLSAQTQQALKSLTTKSSSIAKVFHRM